MIRIASFVLILLVLTTAFAAAAEKPTSVIHVITVRWNEGTTPDQIKEVMASVEKAATQFPGMKRIWLRPLNVQGAPIGKCEDCLPVTHAIVMEFESEKALKDYAGSAAQNTFYETYKKHRFQSRTHDITN